MAVKGWDDTEKKAKEAGGGNFIKLDDGESIQVVFVGEPLADERVWIGEGKDRKSVEYDPKKHTEKPRLRVKINAFVPGTGMRIFEMSPTTFKQVVKMRSKGWLESRVFEISREGTELKTKYTILPERDIDAKLKAELADAKPFDLEKVDDDTSFDPDELDGGRISDADKKALIERMKRLPRQECDAILANLALSKVSDMLQRDLEPTKKKLDALEQKHLGQQAAADNDPYR